MEPVIRRLIGGPLLACGCAIAFLSALVTGGYAAAALPQVIGAEDPRAASPVIGIMLFGVFLVGSGVLAAATGWAILGARPAPRS